LFIFIIHKPQHLKKLSLSLLNFQQSPSRITFKSDQFSYVNTRLSLSMEWMKKPKLPVSIYSITKPTFWNYRAPTTLMKIILNLPGKFWIYNQQYSLSQPVLLSSDTNI